MPSLTLTVELTEQEISFFLAASDFQVVDSEDLPSLRGDELGSKSQAMFAAGVAKKILHAARIVAMDGPQERAGGGAA